MTVRFISVSDITMSVTMHNIRHSSLHTYWHDAIEGEHALYPGAHDVHHGGLVDDDEPRHVHHLHEEEVVDGGVEVVEHARVREAGDGGAARPGQHAAARRRARPQRRQLGRRARPSLRRFAEYDTTYAAQSVL